MSNNSGTAKVKIVKNERDPPLFTSKQLIQFQKILRNTTQVIVRHRICLQTDGHGETSTPPYNFVAGGIKSDRSKSKVKGERTFLGTYVKNILLQMTTYLCTLNNLFIVFVNYLVIDIALAKFTNRLETMAMKMIALC
jgi:hypothetical protein